MTDQKTTDPSAHKDNAVKDQIEQAAAELRRLRDELKVQFKLGSSDAKDAWAAVETALGGVETNLQTASRKLGDMTEKARLEASLALAEVKNRWPAMEAAIDQLGQQAKDTVAGVKSDAQGKIDMARLRTTLAGMDAASLAEVIEKKSAAAFSQAKVELQRESEAAATELKKAFDGLKRRLAGGAK